MKKSKIPVFDEPDDDEINAAFAVAQTGGKEGQDNLLILLDRFRDGLVYRLNQWKGVPWHDAEDVAGHLLKNLLKGVREHRLAPPKIPWGEMLFIRARKLNWRIKQKRCGFTVPLDEEEWADDSDVAHDAVRLKGSKSQKSCYIEPTPAEWKEETEIALKNASTRLTEREQAILKARVAGMPHKEIAKALGTSTTAIRVQYCRAHKKMRDSA